ncbi:MAG: beta-propeller domain-containing protein, partial [Eubacteriales bacterium]|nr:beta-propeller domain-containing protein [Eubacteriales bacterium]
NMFIVIGQDRLAQPRTEAERATAAGTADVSVAGASAAAIPEKSGDSVPADSSSFVRPYYDYGADMIAPYSQAVSVRIYSTIDIRKPVLTRTVAVDGYYVSSRKIADALYIITNKNAYNYSEGTPEPVIPIFRDSAAGDDAVRLPYDKMYYFPGTEMSSYVVIGTIPLNNTGEAAKISAYLGAGNNIYSSAGNLYIAAGRYSEVRAAASNISSTTDVAPVPEGVIRYDLNTLVLKFTLTPNGPEPAYKGEVPGSVLNQFSMDEYLGYFRIATTKGDVWGTGENLSKNNIYVLDGNMNIAGKIEDIAPGEKIYSARFMGARAYMVTFRITDPLFVIDLGNPAAPKILGALKIPGYSDYLHPYDENHLIGFGKDTAEVSNSTFGSGTESTMSFYQGIKMALFDVTDPANPVQKFSVIIGDRGTDSELLRNHKALLFSKEKNIIAFPVTLYEKPADIGIQGDDLYKATQYGQFTFQGAYVYSLDPDAGFVLKGRVTHMTEDDYLKAGSHYYTSEKAVKRIIYIRDTLYTLSDSVIMANLTEGLAYAGQVRLP